MFIKDTIIFPALEAMGDKFNSPEAVVMLAAIGFQESAFEHRRQQPGPARGFWQFEQAGGVAGVMQHPASREKAQWACAQLRYNFDADTIHAALEHNDTLAVIFARLLLWADPNPLPAIGDRGAAWGYYLRNWRPGKPHLNRWSTSYQRATKATEGTKQ